MPFRRTKPRSSTTPTTAPTITRCTKRAEVLVSRKREQEHARARRLQFGDEEDATEGEQRVAVRLLRVGGGDARFVRCEEAAALRLFERVEIGPQRGPLGPADDGIVAGEDVQIFGQPDVEPA